MFSSSLALLLPVLDEAGAIIALRYVAQTSPFPVTYVQICEELGANHYHIHKNSLMENELIEHSFRTDQDEFFYLLEETSEDINELNRWFQKYLITDNTIRPHMGINMLRPIGVRCPVRISSE